MKLSNTTQWPDQMLRRMVSWCCKQIGLPVRTVEAAEFGKRRRGSYNGRCWCWGNRIRVVIGPPSEFPTTPHLYPGRASLAFLSPGYADQVEALIGVTAHELTHLRDHHRTGWGERSTRFEERRVTELFRAERETLLARWNAPSRISSAATSSPPRP